MHLAHLIAIGLPILSAALLAFAAFGGTILICCLLSPARKRADALSFAACELEDRWMTGEEIYRKAVSNGSDLTREEFVALSTEMEEIAGVQRRRDSPAGTPEDVRAFTERYRRIS